MRIRAVLLVAAALALPAAPSHAAGARLCPAGYTGVVVYDAGGDLVTACVRTGDVTGVVGEVVGYARAYVDDVRNWVRGLPPRCWTYDDYIVCEDPGPIPLPGQN